MTGASRRYRDFLVMSEEELEKTIRTFEGTTKSRARDRVLGDLRRARLYRSLRVLPGGKK